MARVIDISGKLTNEKPQIKISEDFTFEVNASKNNVIKIQTSISNDGKSDVELMDEVMEILIGNEAFKRLSDMELTLSDYKCVYAAVMAAVNGEDLEATEERFQKS